MMKDGLFERFPMDAIFGIHNWPGLAAGQFAIKTGPVFASGNRFKITIRGKGAHAAMPHNGVDPVLVACQMVQAFQTVITRNKRPLDMAVISTTMIHAGEAVNVMPETCEIRGTVRTFTIEVLDMIEQRLRQIAAATCQAFDATCEFEFERYYPPTINHPGETEFVRNVLSAFAGERNVVEFEPTMGSEDFSFYLLEKPGCYFLIGNGEGEHRAGGHGAGPCTLHNPSYDFNDALIPLGGSMWTQLACTVSAEPSPTTFARVVPQRSANATVGIGEHNNEDRILDAEVAQQQTHDLGFVVFLKFHPAAVR